MKKVGIIGGGASGMLAAIFAARKGVSVVLFEKQKCLGRKVLVTGNGRCNISNTSLSPESYHGTNPGFVNNVFGRFGLDETRAFFESIGVPFVEGKNGKLFPASLQASTVPAMLEYELVRLGVDIQLHRKIDVIRKEGSGFSLTTAGKEKHSYDSIVLAAGSCAYPQLGASHAGYDLARSLGHTIKDLFPALLPINIPLKKIHRLQGIKWDVGLSVVCDKTIYSQAEGELLFTAYGISGPVAFDVSRCVNALIMQGKIPEIEIDFFPDRTLTEVRSLCDIVWEDNSKDLGFSLLGILKQRMPGIIMECLSIDHTKKVGDIDARTRDAIIRSLKGFRIMPGEIRSFNEAVVAAGGVLVDEVNPATMESRIVPNFYLTGELLDIDGDSGGYNLQFAWSTGALAGMAQ